MANTGGGSRKLLWLMVVLVVVSLSAAGAAFYILMGNGEQRASQGQAPERRAPIFVTIDPFTVNLVDDARGSRLLYTGLSLKVGDQESREILQEHMPQVRSRLLMLLSGQEASDLTSPGGKSQLADKIVATLSDPLTEHQPDLQIKDVLFTEFIVQ